MLTTDPPSSGRARALSRASGNVALAATAVIAMALALLLMTALRNVAPDDGARVSLAAESSPTTHTIKIEDYKYVPENLTIKVGDIVTWTNYDTAPHTVTTTAGPAKFDSDRMDKGDSFSVTFTIAGTYSYYCKYHPDMTATITVEGDSSHDGGHDSGDDTGGDTGGDSGGDSGASCGASGVLGPFEEHFYATHLGESPSEQVADAADLDQYAKTHTVLFGEMLKPAVEGEMSKPFTDHVYATHLGESPGEQVADASDLDQYAKTHTAMFGAMAKPALGDSGSCGVGSCSAGVLGPFEEHFYATHLGESPSEQVADASDLDQYAKTHTVLFGQMLKPAVEGEMAKPFTDHVYATHLGESPSEQVADAADLDQWVKSHTAMFGAMGKPALGTC